MSPLRSDAQQNRDALIAAAGRLFERGGPDVPLDQIAKAAGVGNATLYRHFPTRPDLLVAVYAEEVAQLQQMSDRLSERPDEGEALAEWLRTFVHHVATKRGLALALPDDGERGALFSDWHAAMHEAASKLVGRAQDAGAVRPDLEADDLLALAAGIALTGSSPARLDGLLALIRDGYRA